MKSTKQLSYGSEFSAAFDISASLNEPVEIAPFQRAIISTGLFFKDMPKDLCVLICSRSGLAANYGIMVLNAPGVIDPDYTGEVKVILFNTSSDTFVVKDKDRIAQGLLTPIFRVSDAEFGGVRGSGGFGSTGV